MTRLRLAHLTGLATLLFLAGCPDSNNNAVATGKGSIQALHAIPDLGTIGFLIEETTLASLSFKQSSGITEFDNLEYAFRFDVFLPGDTEATTISSATISVDSVYHRTAGSRRPLAPPRRNQSHGLPE